MIIHHILLVYLPKVSENEDSEELKISKTEIYAWSALQPFRQSVYTAVMPDTYAGRGSHVLLCEENTELAVRELENVLDFQKKEILYCLNRVEEQTGKEYGTIIRDLYTNTAKEHYECVMEHIRCVSQFLAGEYQISSRFYNTYTRSARLLPGDIEAIKKSPEDWALVRFPLEQ